MANQYREKVFLYSRERCHKFGIRAEALKADRCQIPIQCHPNTYIDIPEQQQQQQREIDIPKTAEELIGVYRIKKLILHLAIDEKGLENRNKIL